MNLLIKGQCEQPGCGHDFQMIRVDETDNYAATCGVCGATGTISVGLVSGDPQSLSLFRGPPESDRKSAAKAEGPEPASAAKR